MVHKKFKAAIKCITLLSILASCGGGSSGSDASQAVNPVFQSSVILADPSNASGGVVYITEQGSGYTKRYVAFMSNTADAPKDYFATYADSSNDVNAATSVSNYSIIDPNIGQGNRWIGGSAPVSGTLPATLSYSGVGTLLIKNNFDPDSPGAWPAGSEYSGYGLNLSGIIDTNIPGNSTLAVADPNRFAMDFNITSFNSDGTFQGNSVLNYNKGLLETGNFAGAVFGLDINKTGERAEIGEQAGLVGVGANHTYDFRMWKN